MKLSTITFSGGTKNSQVLRPLEDCLPKRFAIFPTSRHEDLHEIYLLNHQGTVFQHVGHLTGTLNALRKESRKRKKKPGKERADILAHSRP